MAIKKDNINSLSEIIKDELSKYEKKIDTKDVGQIVSVGDSIVSIYGIEDAMYGELIEFYNGEHGLVLNLEEHIIGVAIFSNNSSLKEGDTCYKTGRILSVPVGDNLLGRVIDALGRPIDGKGEIVTTENRNIESPSPLIMDRKKINRPLETGIKAIDSMIPIGKGQRELIIGDRQTGKTALAIDTIINQKGKNVICIYCSIGQKNSSLASIVESLKKNNALDYTVVISSGASESVALQYICPYSATAIGEYWMKQGKDVLIIYDDLSKHAIAYRTLLLLLRRSPGREAYPGDIFYIHSRLLERSCQLNDELGGGSLTALPIVETQEGDISSYIPTNIISITDGQLFLNTDLFNMGQRPAIDSTLSVSRVGSNAQYKIMKEVSSGIRIDLANYFSMLDFSRFGSDLDKRTQKILIHGKVLLEVLKQRQYRVLDLAQEIVDLYVTKLGELDDIPTSKIHNVLKLLNNSILSRNENFFKKINETKEFNDEDKEFVLNILSIVKKSIREDIK